MTLAEQVYESIRDGILDGRLPPGEFIREQSIAKELRVSRTPVREALGRLASEGFLERYAHRGFRVPDEPFRELVQLYPIIANLEVFALHLGFARLNARDISNLRNTNDRMRAAMREGAAQALIDHNNAFHRQLSARCSNRRLCDLLDDLRRQVMRLELWSVAHWDHVEEAIEQHEEILTAIEDGEELRAVSLLRENRLQTYRKFLEEIEDERVAVGVIDSLDA